MNKKNKKLLNDVVEVSSFLYKEQPIKKTIEISLMYSLFYYSQLPQNETIRGISIIPGYLILKYLANHPTTSSWNQLYKNILPKKTLKEKISNSFKKLKDDFKQKYTYLKYSSYILVSSAMALGFANNGRNNYYPDKNIFDLDVLMNNPKLTSALIFTTYYSFGITKNVFKLYQNMLHENITQNIKNKTLFKKLKNEVTINLESSLDEEMKKETKNYHNIIYLSNQLNKLTYGLGFITKELYEGKDLTSNETFFNKFYFFLAAKQNLKYKDKDLFLFSTSLTLNLEKEIKIDYAKKSIDKIESFNLSTDDKLSAISSLALFFETANDLEYKEKSWKKYVEVSKKESSRLENLLDAGGTKGTFKTIATPTYQTGVEEFVVRVKISKDKNKILKEYNQTKILEGILEDEFFTVPKMLYTDKYKEFQYLSELYYWQNNLEEYIKKNKPSNEEIKALLKDALNATEVIQEIFGLKLELKKEDLFKKYLDESNWLHSNDNIFNKNKLRKRIEKIYQSKIMWKSSTDSHFLNFLASENHYQKYLNDEPHRIIKVDNEESKLLPNAEPLNLFMYNRDLIPDEVFNELFEPYKENISNQLLLISIRTPSFIKGFGSIKNPNIKKIDTYLKNNQKLIHENLNNFTKKDYPFALEMIAELDKNRQNLPKIIEYLTSKKTS